MSKSLQVLFLHDLNESNEKIVKQNFSSFKDRKVDIQAIHDEDLLGLEGSFPVPLNSFIPRGSRRWSTETVLLNYILINEHKLQHDYYMFCEYDCYCNCDLNKFIKPYHKYDVTAPFIVNFENEPNWMWFYNLSHIKQEDLINKKIGFRPSVFLLFKRESLIYLAQAYKKLWPFFQNVNSESRLGTLCNFLNFSIGEYKNLGNSVAWFESIFRKDSNILHPVKRLMTNEYFMDYPSSNNVFNNTTWYFARIEKNNDHKVKTLLAKLKLNKNGNINGYENFNEKFWNIQNNNLIFLNGKGGVTTIFKKLNDNIFIGDYYNGEIFENSALIDTNFHILFKFKKDLIS